MFGKTKDVTAAILAVVTIGGVAIAIPIMGGILSIGFSLWIGYLILQDKRKVRLKNRQSNQKD